MSAADPRAAGTHECRVSPFVANSKGGSVGGLTRDSDGWTGDWTRLQDRAESLVGIE